MKFAWLKTDFDKRHKSSIGKRLDKYGSIMRNVVPFGTLSRIQIYSLCEIGRISCNEQINSTGYVIVDSHHIRIGAERDVKTQVVFIRLQSSLWMGLEINRDRPRKWICLMIKEKISKPKMNRYRGWSAHGRGENPMFQVAESISFTFRCQNSESCQTAPQMIPYQVDAGSESY